MADLLQGAKKGHLRDASVWACKMHACNLMKESTLKYRFTLVCLRHDLDQNLTFK